MSKAQPPEVIHVSADHDFPNAGESSCCIGAAVYGPGRCTCWDPVHDLPVTGECQEGPMPVRTAMCSDCAFRPDSPERSGHHSAGQDAEDLEDVVVRGQFLCHDGMPRPAAWVHGPTATQVQLPGDDLNYQPRQRGERSWRQDGRPALMCAGWAARRRALEAGVERAAHVQGARS